MARRLALALAAAGLLAMPAGAVAGTYLGCGFRDNYSVTAHPHACFLAWPDLGDAAAMNIKHIHWHSWGGAVAPARGLWRYRTYEPWSHVRLLAFHKRSCGNGSLYTRVRVTVLYQGHWQVWGTWKTMTCSDVPAD